MNGLLEKLDDLPRPAWIALVVLGFIVFWPVGLALLIYLNWSGRMFCSHRGYGRWYGPEERDAVRSEWRARREEWRAWKRRSRWAQRHGSGNVAFDEYREETLRRLDEEQQEFRDFLDRLVLELDLEIGLHPSLQFLRVLPGFAAARPVGMGMDVDGDDVFQIDHEGSVRRLEGRVGEGRAPKCLPDGSPVPQCGI